MHRILVLRGGALGDFIVTLPTLAALRARWPEAQIELVGNATAAQLALHRGVLNAVHSQHESRWAQLFLSEPLPTEFGAWLGSFDLILNYWPDADGELRNRFPLHPRQTFLSTAAHPTRVRAARHYAEPLRALGIAVARDDFSLRLDSKVGRVIPNPPLEFPLTFGSESNRPLNDNPPDLSSAPIALHPGSGSPTKNWPLPRWLELGRWLRTTHAAELLIVTGEGESSATRSAFSAIGRDAHALPLEELVTVLSSCRAFLGHDSGVSHLAAACGVPSVLLFGPTDPAIWAPPTPHVHVLRKGPSLDAISVSDVQTVISELLLRRR